MENEKELLKIKRKFSPKYILTGKMIEPYLVFLLLIIVCFSSKRILYGIIIILLFVLFTFVKLVFEKRKSNQTYMKFFNDRIEYKGKVLFRNQERVLKYDEIKDITFTQGITFLEKRFQKAFGFGNIYVYPKKGNILTKGMQIELVENINEKIEEIKSIVGDKIR